MHSNKHEKHEPTMGNMSQKLAKREDFI